MKVPSRPSLTYANSYLPHNQHGIFPKCLGQDQLVLHPNAGIEQEFGLAQRMPEHRVLVGWCRQIADAVTRSISLEYWFASS